MEDIKIDGKTFQLEKSCNRFYLYYLGSQIGELINGQAGLDRQYKGSFEKWVAFIQKRDMNRIDNIDYQIEKLKDKQTQLSDRWVSRENS